MPRRYGIGILSQKKVGRISRKMSMDTDLKELKEKLKEIKRLYEEAIKEGGRKAVLSLIRSQRLIGIIHRYIKEQLISFGVSPSKIYPEINSATPELSMVGFLKKKRQDISIISEKFKKEEIKNGVLMGKTDDIGKDVMDKSISINVRSQLSSLAKNFDTLYERTFAEALNLHLRSPKLVMGEVYMIPLIAYDPDKINRGKIGWKEKLPIKYIPAFRELNNRESHEIDEYKYERVCLLIVDFSEEEPKIVISSEDLFKMGWIKKEEIDTFSLDGLDIQNFVKDLLNAYKKRHGDLSLLKD